MEATVVKPFSEFDGWLRVFWILSVLSVVLSIVSAIMVLGLITWDRARSFLGGTVLVLYCIKLAPLLIDAAFTVYVLKIIRSREPDVPSSVAAILIVTFVITIIFRLLELYWLNKHPEVLSKYQHNVDVFYPLKGILFTVIWVQYFRLSERVKVYYGANAFKQANA
jgi:uncharacterized membrane protein